MLPWNYPKTREYIDWRWPYSCVLSLMTVFSAQFAEGGGSVHAHPMSCSLSTPYTRFASPSPPPPQQDYSKV